MASIKKHYGKGSILPALPDDGNLRMYTMRFCPFAQRVHLVLDAKNIPYHSIYINLTEKPEWLQTKSPLGKVPALELMNEPKSPLVFESLIVCDYLDEKYPEIYLSSKNALQKALDKILIERFSGIMPVLYKIITSDFQKEDFEQVVEGLKIFDNELKDRNTAFFAGDKPGMLDFMIWPWCERIFMIKYLSDDKLEIDEKVLPHYTRWCELMKKNETVQKTYLDAETHAKFIIGRRAGKPDYDMLFK